MKDMYQLLKREQCVMDLLWEEGEALTSVDILERMRDIMINPTYVHRAINHLLEVGLIQECGSIRYNTQYARMFVPSMTREEYAAKYLISHGIKMDLLGKLMVELFNETRDESKTDEENTDEMIALLQEIIDALKARNDAQNKGKDDI